MKRIMKIITLILVMALCAMFAACGSEEEEEKRSSLRSKDRSEEVEEDEDDEDDEEYDEEYDEYEEDPEELYEEEQDLTDDEETGDGGSEYDDPSELPPYTYTGTDEVLRVISEYMASDAAGSLYGNGTTVYIPFCIIAETDTTDPEDILVFGSYNVDGYELFNTTLITTSGSRGSGIFHLRKNGDGTYEVAGAELPMTDQEGNELFAQYEGIEEKVRAITDEKKSQARAEAIAGYVNANGLHITQWQDYGWPPQAVLNAPPTTEEEQLYTYVSELGYAVTYDLRELSINPGMSEDMFGKVDGDTFTGTLMVIKRAEDVSDPDEALQEEAAIYGEKIEITDTTIGNGIDCRTAQWNAELYDGRIFRFIGYGFTTKNGVMVVLLETTYQKGVSEMSMEDLERFFAASVASITLME